MLRLSSNGNFYTRQLGELVVYCTVHLNVIWSPFQNHTFHFTAEQK